MDRCTRRLSRGKLTTDIVLAVVFALVCLPFALLGTPVDLVALVAVRRRPRGATPLAGLVARRRVGRPRSCRWPRCATSSSYDVGRAGRALLDGGARRSDREVARASSRPASARVVADRLPRASLKPLFDHGDRPSADDAVRARSARRLPLRRLHRRARARRGRPDSSSRSVRDSPRGAPPRGASRTASARSSSTATSSSRSATASPATCTTSSRTRSPS